MREIPLADSVTHALTALVPAGKPVMVITLVPGGAVNCELLAIRAATGAVMAFVEGSAGNNDTSSVFIGSPEFGHSASKGCCFCSLLPDVCANDGIMLAGEVIIDNITRVRAATGRNRFLRRLINAVLVSFNILLLLLHIQISHRPVLILWGVYGWHSHYSYYGQ